MMQSALRYFVVQDLWNREFDRAGADVERDVQLGAQQLHTSHSAAVRQPQSYLLRADRIEIPDPAALHRGIRVVQDVERETPFCLPCEALDYAVTFNRYRRIGACHPTDRVLQESRQIGIPGLPHRALDVAG